MVEFNGHGLSYVLRDYLTSKEYSLLGERQFELLKSIDPNDQHLSSEELQAKTLEKVKSGVLNLNMFNRIRDQVLSTLILTPKDCKVDDIPADLMLQMTAHINQLYLALVKTIDTGAAEKKKLI